MEKKKFCRENYYYFIKIICKISYWKYSIKLKSEKNENCILNTHFIFLRVEYICKYIKYYTINLFESVNYSEH